MVVIFMMLNFFPRSQIAFLCPTSVLCRQHFLNFKSRFANFGFSVVELSSFNSHKENRRIKKMIHQGEYNIIIGTHAMLNSSKIFADLKMLVIDEEQCFGLQQKMLLSSLYPKIHVISLSATPIPRTLHMAMNGVHDISIIKEKPSKSSTITTQVIQYTEDLIKFYVEREINKGGQVFYVTPKISGLSNLHDRIINLFPVLKIAKLHGKMSDKDISSVMSDFYDNKIHILLSTTIVAFGLHVANANTIFIEGSHMLGLSQLYQLRGRVGRDKEPGYAYYVLDSNSGVSSSAEKRLSIMKRIDHLGHVGLAQEDLYMRGSGSLIGTDQSGHVKDIGVEMYYDMLQSALSQAKKNSETSPLQIIAAVTASVDSFIPNSYIPDEVERIHLYNMLAKNNDPSNIQSIQKRIKDKYGTVPVETNNFFTIAKIQKICSKRMISKVNLDANIIHIAFSSFQPDYNMIKDLQNIIRQSFTDASIQVIENKLRITTSSTAQKNLPALYDVFSQLR